MGRPKTTATVVISTRVTTGTAHLLDIWRQGRTRAQYLKLLLNAEAKARAEGTSLLLPEDRQ